MFIIIGINVSGRTANTTIGGEINGGWMSGGTTNTFGGGLNKVILNAKPKYLIKNSYAN